MQLHATTIALDGAGLLILGPSGSGKSSLALQLMAAGAVLVADDRTDLCRQGDAIVASCPPALLGRIGGRIPHRIGLGRVDRAVGFRRDPPCGDGLSHSAFVHPAQGGIGAPRQPHLSTFSN